jgi:hypothetical protein
LTKAEVDCHGEAKNKIERLTGRLFGSQRSSTGLPSTPSKACCPPDKLHVQSLKTASQWDLLASGEALVWLTRCLAISAGKGRMLQTLMGLFCRELLGCDTIDVVGLEIQGDQGLG